MQNEIWYHGTPYDFDNFSLDYVGRNTERDDAQRGIFFTDELGMAQLFGEKVLKCSVELSKGLNLEAIFSNINQSSDIVKILYGEVLDSVSALEFLDDNIDIANYGEFMENFNCRDVIQDFIDLGYDHSFSRFAEGKTELCVFDPAKVIILDRDIIKNMMETQLMVQQVYEPTLTYLRTVLMSNDRSKIDYLYMQFNKEINSIPDRIDGINISKEKKLKILAGLDFEQGFICYDVQNGKLFRTLRDVLDVKSPVLFSAVQQELSRHSGRAGH